MCSLPSELLSDSVFFSYLACILGLSEIKINEIICSSSSIKISYDEYEIEIKITVQKSNRKYRKLNVFKSLKANFQNHHLPAIDVTYFK